MGKPNDNSLMYVMDPLSCSWAAFRHGDFLPGKSGAYRSELPGPDHTSIAGPISGLGA
jgi:hypothetical protein